MGLKSKKNKLPNNKKEPKADIELVKCQICGFPGEFFTDLNGTLSRPVRIARPLVRITKNRRELAMYAHVDPCLLEMARRKQ